jgi:hypothetical protein
LDSQRRSILITCAGSELRTLGVCRSRAYSATGTTGDRHVRSRSYITSLDWKPAAKRNGASAWDRNGRVAPLSSAGEGADSRRRESRDMATAGRSSLATGRRGAPLFQGGLKHGHRKLLLLVYEFVIIRELRLGPCLHLK